MKSTKVPRSKVTAGRNVSYWTDSVEPLKFRKLDHAVDTDVVVVGGGIAGLSVAYCLVQSGRKVVVIEDGLIGSGETGRTTAHLASALDDRFYELERIFGEEDTRLIAQSHKVAIDFIERTWKYEGFECDFQRVDGYLFLHPTDSEESLAKEAAAARRAGMEVIELPLMPGIQQQAKCLKFYDQAQFHPLKYLRGISKAVSERGGEIYTETHADQIDHEGVTTSDGFRITARHVVVATNTPVNNKYIMHLKQYPYRSYVIGAKIKKGVLPRALWWDTGDFSMDSDMAPYHYVRTQPLDSTHDLLIVGGEDHPTGHIDNSVLEEEDRYALLEYWMRQHFEAEEIVYQWSGQVMEPMDSLAYIGRNPMDKNNVYIATGDSGHGMTHGTIAGILIADLINERSNPWEKIYDPARFKIFKSGRTYFKELIGGMLSYLKNKPKDTKLVELSSIPTGEGKVVELEGKKFGAYRDGEDTIHFVGAECTHMGCIINWNNDEKSWDCPCHGSRFTPQGKVMNGPANKDLGYHSEKSSNINNDNK